MVFDKWYLIKSISAVTNYNSSSCSELKILLPRKELSLVVFDSPPITKPLLSFSLNLKVMAILMLLEWEEI